MEAEQKRLGGTLAEVSPTSPGAPLKRDWEWGADYDAAPAARVAPRFFRVKCLSAHYEALN